MTSKLMKFFWSSLLGLGLGCGSQLGSSDGEADGELDMSWALGFFHRPDTGVGQGKGMLTMYELRSDGTGEVVIDDCREGVLGPYELSWRALSEDEVEVFGRDEEPFQWVQGLKESVILTPAEEGFVQANDSGSMPTVYERGKLCVASRPSVGECMDIGMTVEVCEG